MDCSAKPAGTDNCYKRERVHGGGNMLDKAIRYPTSRIKKMSCYRVLISTKANIMLKARSRAVGTERTILSPFTKEYRVLAADSGIRLFLEGSLLLRRAPTTLVLNLGCTCVIVGYG
ncbi:hypothetical protein NC653_030568 [Populus alba x Populus x berolinensis]|uniref:Uncharacterized protein n=1 Tax=Populus alba x Populus x berolinensis TaxID=444605 RepID=A0AAD6LWD2_9ROSI|nr:hypothetical protein NC653_030568 [Populus alba x Populus x berolinensis]